VLLADTGVSEAGLNAMKLVDLFCGSGGFSLGAHQAGFDVAAAFDVDPILTSSFPANFPNTKLHLADVAVLTGKEVEYAVGGKVDGVFGGPPCQGFSDIGLRQANDERRQLLGHFFRLVRELRPKFFVMENVPGLAYRDARSVLDEAIDIVANNYDILGPCVWDAADFGAPTKRRRIFVIGIARSIGAPLTLEEVAVRQKPAATVVDAILDLQNARRLKDADGFDVWEITKRGRPSNYAKRLRSPDGRFTGHRFTTHTPKVTQRFAKVLPGGVDEVGRHPRLDWDGQCPTLRAGTGADRGSFQAVRPIHPDEPRVITVREAARLQGFPDRHIFHPTVWHSFRMIGNSVSPFMSRAIFEALAEKFGSERNARVTTQPSWLQQAAE